MNVSVFLMVLGTFAVMIGVVAGLVGLGVWLRIRTWQSAAVVIGAIWVGVAALIACIPGVH
jgi:hypothetical protein